MKYHILDQKCNFLTEPKAVALPITLSWLYADDYRRDLVQCSYSIKIATDKGMKNIVWKSGTVRSNAMLVDLSDFTPKPCTAYFWTIETELNDGTESEGEVAFFETALEDGAFTKLGAKWLTCGKEAGNEPASLTFRRRYKNDDNIEKARLYLFGLGFAALSVNGAEKDERILAPANSDYNKYCYYETYDITEDIEHGDNLVEVTVSGGYNKDYLQFGYRWLGVKGIRAVLVLTDFSGKISYIVTDSEWTWSENEITESSLYGGETFDARRKDFSEENVVEDNDAAPKGALLPRQMPQITLLNEDDPVACFPDPDGGIIYDFGKNLSGVPQIIVKAPAGTKIKLEHGELLTYESSLSPWTNRTADATDTYICSGDGEEYYMPTTTYHGFRYIRVNGTESCTIFKIQAIRISADVDYCGRPNRFLCSDPMLNRIQENAVNSLLSNLVSIPTDCNMRNERTPCHMDSMCVEEAAIYNFDMAAYYRKWGADTQGEVGNADWNNDQINIAWRMYTLYGDLYLARKFYSSYKAMIEHMIKTSDNYLFTTDNGCGDWCHPNDNTWGTIGGNNHELHTALFYVFTRRMQVLADKLAKVEDIDFFKSTADTIKQEFNRRLVGEDGTLHGGRQTSYLMPLYYELANEKTKPLIYAKLMETIRATNMIDVGIFGMTAFIDVPSLGGNADDVYEAFRTSKWPSFGYQIANGAKSLWEEWAYTGVMHSHNHAMFASVSASLYKIYAGITSIEPGFRRVRVMPILPRALRFAEAKINTASGVIYVRTERMSGSHDGSYDWTNMELTVPVNVRAEVHIPVYSAEGTGICILDGDRMLDKKTFRYENRCFVKEVGSGHYNFRVVPAALLYPDTAISFTYQFTNEDGTVLKSATVPYNTVVEPPEETPKKPGNDAGEYEFTGWKDWQKGRRLAEGYIYTAQYKKK